jgi:predicted transcriptional regulator
MVKVTEPEEAIISIRPKFADAILSGAKTIELRRRIPTIQTGARLWIYATRPIGAVVGSATIDAIVRGRPDMVWEACGGRANVSRLEFNRYFHGAPEAIGISLAAIQKIRAIGIEKLKGWRDGFHPPQVMCKITANEAKNLRGLVFEHDGGEVAIRNS